MKKALAAIGFTLLALSSAQAFAAPVTMAEATKAADATVAAWTTMSATKIKALYAPGVVGFDMIAAPLVTDHAAWNKNQDAFAAAKIDKEVQKQRKIQMLDGDVFVVSGLWDITSTAKPETTRPYAAATSINGWVRSGRSSTSIARSRRSVNSRRA